MKTTILKFGLLMFALFAFSQVNAQDKKQPDPEKMFASFDANDDKSISLEEFKNKKRKNEVPAEALEKRYAAMDANSDGSVTLEEFKAGMMKGKKTEGMKKKKEKTSDDND
ncbi:EF-hand domain-containing protein [Mariniflexile sp.]|uniref:EF-hand domain-containing protein n=1 Tax=Mariniflexile sp. TaxID=1979402 RepID=UPI004048BFE3